MKYYAILFFLICMVSANAQSDVNQVDSEGRKHGLWRGQYEESKRPRYEGTFVHGKESGIFTYYDDTKAQSVIATREFNPKDNSAYTVFYNQKKNKVSEGKVVNKIHEGTWKYYHENSDILMTIENYKNGKLNGLRTVNYPDGKVAEQATYVDGIRHGPYKKYNVNGALLEEVTYVNGQIHGVAKFYDANGKLASKGPYEHGIKKGVWEFYEQGKPVRTEKHPLRRKFKKSPAKKL